MSAEASSPWPVAADVSRVVARVRPHLHVAFADLVAIDGAVAPGDDEWIAAAPRAMPDAVLRDLADAAERLWRAFDRDVRRAIAAEGARGLASSLGFDPGKIGWIGALRSSVDAPVRGDFVRTRDGFALVEWNVDPCLGGLAGARLFERFDRAGAASDLSFVDPADALARAWGRLRSRARSLVVAIRPGDLEGWGTNADHLVAAARRVGFDASVATVDEAVRLAEGRDRSDPVVVVRLFHIDHVPPIAAAVDRLVACAQDGRAIVAHGFDTELWGDKQWFARVPIPQDLRHFVPETASARAVERLLRDDAAGWVLKPHAGAAGEGVVVGAETDVVTWAAAVDRALAEEGWVAQRFVEPAVVRLPYVDRRGRTAWRDEVETIGIFLVDGRFAGAYARSHDVRAGAVIDARSGFNVVAAEGRAPLSEAIRDRWTAQPDALRANLRAFEDLAVEHLAAHGGDRTDASPRACAAPFASSHLPESGAPIDAIVASLRSDLLPFCHDKRAPRYVAHLDVPPADLAIAAGVLERSLAQDPVTWTSSRAATFLENEVVRWFAALAYPAADRAAGVPCAGGTQANLLAVLMARNLFFQRAGVDVTRVGLVEAHRRAGVRGLRLLVSAAAHASVAAAARHAGFGDDAIVPVDVDTHDAIRTDALSAALFEARRAGDAVPLVVLSAGTVGSGAVDPLREAIATAHAHGARVHVDAAHGAFMLFSRRHARLLAGIDAADSITCDPHKVLGINQGLGMLLVKEAADREAVVKGPAPYFTSIGDAPTTARYTLDGTRPLGALAAWIMMKHLGRTGYERIVDHVVDLTRLFVDAVERRGFDLYAPPTMNIALFRPGRADGRDVDAVLEAVAGSPFRVGRYASARGPFLRAVFVNPATTEDDVLALARFLSRET